MAARAIDGGDDLLVEADDLFDGPDHRSTGGRGWLGMGYRIVYVGVFAPGLVEARRGMNLGTEQKGC
jgi:hypothetical protein